MTIVKNKMEEGLNMLDFTLFDKELKIIWVVVVWAVCKFLAAWES